MMFVEPSSVLKSKEISMFWKLWTDLPSYCIIIEADTLAMMCLLVKQFQFSKYFILEPLLQVY